MTNLSKRTANQTNLSLKIRSSNRNRTKWTGCPDTFSSIAKENDEWNWTLIAVHLDPCPTGWWDFLLYHNDFDFRIIYECIHLISYHIDSRCFHLYFSAYYFWLRLIICIVQLILRLDTFCFFNEFRNFSIHIFLCFWWIQISAFL